MSALFILLQTSGAVIRFEKKQQHKIVMPDIIISWLIVAGGIAVGSINLRFNIFTDTHLQSLRKWFEQKGVKESSFTIWFRGTFRRVLVATIPCLLLVFVFWSVEGGFVTNTPMYMLIAFLTALIVNVLMSKKGILYDQDSLLAAGIARLKDKNLLEIPWLNPVLVTSLCGLAFIIVRNVLAS
jgi:hypothetical protein